MLIFAWAVLYFKKKAFQAYDNYFVYWFFDLIPEIILAIYFVDVT